MLVQLLVFVDAEFVFVGPETIADSLVRLSELLLRFEGLRGVDWLKLSDLSMRADH